MHNVKTSEKTLKFGDVKVNKKKFHVFNQTITLYLVDTEKIVVFDKCKHSDKGFQYFFAIMLMIWLNRYALYYLK